jgi:hypothetical protein
MTARTVHELSDAAWSRLEDKADRLTEQNRAELEYLAQTDRAHGIDALAELLANTDPRETAELLWDERQHELADESLKLFGTVDRTPLARLIRDAAKQYAQDGAEKVRAEDLLDDGSDDAYDDARERGEA